MSTRHYSEKNMQELLDNLTKPKGSLGDLEALSAKLAAVQNRIPPKIEKPEVFIFAGDHGVTQEGVSLYPQEVTRQMVMNFLEGGAGINVIARHCGFDVNIIDAGILNPIDDPRVIDCRIGSGTGNFAQGPAMTELQLETCLANGKSLAEDAANRGVDLAALGDMGIGNTSASAAVLAGVGIPLDDVVDRGTGIDESCLEHKREVIKNALDRHAPLRDVKDVLTKLGGFELAAMVGFILALEGKGIACMLDGFPVTSAAFLAWKTRKEVVSFLFPGHLSKVKGHKAVLDSMGLNPVLDLKMRLGEGTGAVIGGFLVMLSAKIAGEMASFNQAGVSRSSEDEENY